VAKYKLLIKPSAVKEIENIPSKKDRQRIIGRIRALVDDPRPHGSEKLSGHDDKYRVRQGTYRIIYAVGDRELVVYVVNTA